MRLGVNAIHLVPGGSEEDTFLRHGLAALQRLHPEIELVLFTDPVNDGSFPNAQTVCIDQAGTSRAESQLRHAIKDSGVERLLTPLPTIPPKSPVPVVPFVVELQLLEQGGGVTAWCGEVRQRHLSKLVPRASAVVAPSEFARRRLLQWLGVPMDRVVVAPPGADHMPAEPYTRPTDDPYLFSVTPTYAHRNVEGLIHAFDRMRDQIPHTLILMGEQGDAERRDWGERVLRVQRCPLDRLAAFYHHADVVVCPTPQDASGLTVLEALYCGGRVVAARSGAIPELAHSTPFYCDPSSTVSMSGAIFQALEEPAAQRDNRVKSGRQIAAQRLWSRTAERLYIALKR